MPQKRQRSQQSQSLKQLLYIVVSASCFAIGAICVFVWQQHNQKATLFEFQCPQFEIPEELKDRDVSAVIAARNSGNQKLVAQLNYRAQSRLRRVVEEV